jgi:DNA end-binding protein Ku
MAERAFWKGYLKLSLVTCPVVLVPVVSGAEKIRFTLLNRATGEPLVSRYVDAVSGAPVADEDQVKGYPVGEERFVPLEDAEIDSVALKTTHTLEIETFVAGDELDRIWLDRAHYLVPDDPVGAEAYVVIRQAMADSGTLGIARLVLYRRERAVMLQPYGKGMLLWTLRHGEEVRAPADYFGDLAGQAPPADQLKLACALVKARSRAWTPALAADPVQDNLERLIAAKRRGKPVRRARVARSGRGGKVIDIMDALQRSLAKDRGGAGRRR